MSALSKFHSTKLSIQELLSGRIRLQRYGLFLKLKHLYPNKMQINFILATRLQRNTFHWTYRTRTCSFGKVRVCHKSMTHPHVLV